MKKINILLLALGILFIGNSCSDDFDDMNTPSDAVDVVDPSYFFNNMVNGVYENYQRNVNLYPDFYAQYWANTVSSFESPRYEYVNGWVGNQWKEFYTDHLTEALAIVDQNSDNEYAVNEIACANIWICYFWSRMTDTYGDIPYFGAGYGETVEYNTQQEIYYDLFERLDAAVESLVDDEAQQNYGTYDLVYGGDIDKWRKFGNSLRLRFAMRLTNIDPDKAATEAAAAISGTGGLMTSNDDVAKVGMWSSGWYDYLHQMAWSWDNCRASQTFTNYCYSESSVGEDPRTPFWFAYKVDGENMTKEEAGFSEYTGVLNGYNTVPSDANDNGCTINLEGGYVDFVGDGADNDMYLPVMFYSEVLFLQAEAAMRGYISGDADALYKEGIQASMDYVGVDASDATDYIAGVTSITGADESNLKVLISQKWLANFPNGVEAWADFRRTDYPDITLPVDGVSGNASVASGTWVKRIRYPDNAHEQEEEFMPSSLNTTTTDRMDTKVWWDTADTQDKTSGLMDSNL
ncbi:SusD/RagB family nutrient-binding outer membrane lipoprotein [Labilibaculum sp.]|uniref:SusD/RagB family nutrient-binding outer membrane lipoprotein n=1 Tax=Labilibaculum sp. TaxID=2060723 RepID=UPI003563CE45